MPERAEFEKCPDELAQLPNYLGRFKEETGNFPSSIEDQLFTAIRGLDDSET